MLQQLTEAGFRVVALQRGPELETGQFSDDELQIIIRDGLFAADQLESYRLEEGEEARKALFGPACRRCCCDSIVITVLYSAISSDDNGPSMT